MTTKLPPANLPPNAMPWAREVQRRLGDVVRRSEIAATNIGAFGQAVVATNEHQVRLSGALAENEAALATAQGQLDALNAPDGPLATLDAELSAITAPDGPLANIQAELDGVTGPGGSLEVLGGDLDALDQTINSPTGPVQTAIDQAQAANDDLNTLNTETLPALNNELGTKVPKLYDTGGAGAAKTYIARDVATLVDTTSGRTDNIVIQTNVTTPTMLRASITGYNYIASRAAIDVSVEAYNYTSTSVSNTAYTSTGTAQVGVRFGRGADLRLAIIISPPTGGWSYVKINVDEAIVSYSGATAEATQGWTTSFVAEANLATTFTEIFSPLVSRDLQDSNLLTQGWRTTGQTTIDGGKITADTVDTAQLRAGSVTTLKMTANSINGDRITGNTLAGDKLIANSVTAREVAARSITAEKVVLAAGENILTNPNFEGGGAGWVSNNATFGTGDGPNGENTMLISGTGQVGSYLGVLDRVNYGSPVEPGAQYRLSVQARTATVAPINSISIYIRAYKDDGTFTTTKAVSNTTATVANTWHTIAGDFTFPTGYTRLVMGLYVETTYTGSVRFAAPSVIRKAGAELIVDGAITTVKMTANSINGDRIQANTLNASKIVAGSITTDRMTANTINGDRILANTLNASKITANTITSREILANSITANEITTGYLVGLKISAGEITGTTITGGTINGTVINSVRYSASDGLQVTRDGGNSTLKITDGNIYSIDLVSGVDKGYVNFGRTADGRGILGLQTYDQAANTSRFFQIGGNTTINDPSFDASTKKLYVDVLLQARTAKFTELEVADGTGNGTHTTMMKPLWGMAYKTTDQITASPNTLQRITFNNDSTLPLATSSSRITIPTNGSGLYQVSFTIQSISQAAGWRDVYIRKNGVDFSGNKFGLPTGSSGTSNIGTGTLVVWLNAGDYVEMWTQGSANHGSTNFNAGTTSMSVARIQY